MPGFWDSFWPNLASTVAGVILGLPVALWLNRRALEHGERIRTAGERTRVADALSVMGEVMKLNSSQLDNLIKVLSEDKALFDPSLDTSAWESVRSDISSEVDPNLRRRLAHHFGRLESLVKLNELYLSFIIGTNASMSSAADTKKKLGPLLLGLASTQRTEAVALVEAAQAAAVQLRPTAS
jgi:hypothetical protein